jgi:hypothetical protein
MRITRVEAKNLKGRSFTYDLSPEVAIVGENFTGKTSIIDAIRLALIGYIPELGKLPKATAQLASGPMEARVEFENNTFASINVADGKVLRSEPPPWVGEIPLLNAAAYFGMTERERNEYVFRIAKTPEAFTKSAIIADLERMSFEEEHSEAVEKAKASVIADLKTASEAESLQDWLVELIGPLQSWFTHHNARAKDTQGAIRLLTELKNRQENQAGNVRQLSDNELQARAASQTAYKTLLDLQVRAKDYASHAARTLRHKELGKALEDRTEIKKLEKLIGEATAKLKPVVKSKVSEVQLDKMRLDHAKLVNRFGIHSQRLDELTEELKALGDQTACPHCGAKSKGWKDHLRANLDKDYLALKKEVDTMVQGLAQGKQELGDAEKEVKAAQDLLTANKEWNRKIQDWESQLDKRQKERDNWLETLDKEKKQLDAEAVEPVAKEDIAAAEAENEEALRVYSEARKRLKEAELLEQDIKRAAQAQLEHETADAHVKVIKAIGKALREKQAALVDAVFGSLLDIANGIVGKILASDLAFHEGEVGRWDGHRWISHKTFSGTEQALTFVAIAAALSQASPVRLLIFDELGRLDDVRRLDLIKLLIDARKGGHIDQFIVAGALEGNHVWMPELQVIQL